jgi:hypothetical protein
VGAFNGVWDLESGGAVLQQDFRLERIFGQPVKPSFSDREHASPGNPGSLVSCFMIF